MPRVKLAKSNGAYIKRDISARLMKNLKDKKMIQSDLAAELDITQPAVSMKLKSGNMTVEEFAKIAHKLDMSAEEIGELLTY